MEPNTRKPVSVCTRLEAWTQGHLPALRWPETHSQSYTGKDKGNGCLRVRNLGICFTTWKLQFTDSMNVTWLSLSYFAKNNGLDLLLQLQWKVVLPSTDSGEVNASTCNKCLVFCPSKHYACCVYQQHQFEFQVITQRMWKGPRGSAPMQGSYNSI